MQVILATNDLVTLSFARSVLDDAGIESVVFDQHTSNIEGSIGIFPRRLHVLDDEATAARRALIDAGLAAQLVAPKP